MTTYILYTTKHGTTKYVANDLAKQLTGKTILINLKEQNEIDLSEANMIILGASIYVGKVQKEMKQFIDAHLEQLLTKPIGLFLCAGHPDKNVVKREMQAAYSEKLRKHATSFLLPGYIYDFSKLHTLERLIVKKIVGIKESRHHLDTAAIKQFTSEINKERYIP
ncbi:protoporphyrinogen oxidase [Paraliobacillus sp. PM-2]|uniref:flavodoxin domain-containing protein n=1 Tax=Paraliobacillus sp. PM-2 TaxID=1462524 RepID=UPI00061BCE67|nr:flavodoxin domain-containing protein [Paraliobacillus sp. PM-2]CQR45985.1 protoporphyrinogen oxidase [Paraliobacillus sp. PM-2]